MPREFRQSSGMLSGAPQQGMLSPGATPAGTQTPSNPDRNAWDNAYGTPRLRRNGSSSIRSPFHSATVNQRRRDPHGRSWNHGIGNCAFNSNLQLSNSTFRRSIQALQQAHVSPAVLAAMCDGSLSCPQGWEVTHRRLLDPNRPQPAAISAARGHPGSGSGPRPAPISQAPPNSNGPRSPGAVFAPAKLAFTRSMAVPALELSSVEPSTGVHHRQGRFAWRQDNLDVEVHSQTNTSDCSNVNKSANWRNLSFNRVTIREVSARCALNESL